MKKKVIIASSIIAGVLIVLLFFGGSKGEKEIVIEAKVKSGLFKIDVNTTGELEAEKSVKIMGPSGLRIVRVWNVKISSIIPEGTVVDSGDWVASLDKTEATEKLRDLESELEVAQTKYTNTMLDTTLELRELRDKLINLEYALEEAEIRLEKSKFEPPTTIRQEEINLSKAERNNLNANDNYHIKVEQAGAKMHEVQINLNQTRRKLKSVQKVLKEFEVTAPESGMVIYRRDWNGSKIKEGSTIGSWDPVVAELPDLNKMISKTYVNEIDISKISVGQKVSIGIDAFPEFKFSGEIKHVANIGEQIPGGDAKVFEVKIKMFETDSVLKPSMTTSNYILISEFDSVLSLPIEAVYSDDSIYWVYQTSGLSNIKKQVIVGPSNENEIIIKKGLKEGEKVILSQLKNAEKYELIPLESN